MNSLRSKIHYLAQYNRLMKEFKEIEQSYEYLKSKIESIQAFQLSDMPKNSGSHDKIIGMLVQKEKIEEIMKDRMENIMLIRTNIESAIAELDDVNHRRILGLRYINDKNWIEITRIMGYKERHIVKIHRKAIARIDIIIKP